MAAEPAQLASSHYRELPLPKEGERNVLITSALPYVNNVPHLGNIIGCVLSADVYARYCRARGINTLFICGTDEYGTATETKALQEGLTPQQICDKYHKIHSDIYRWFDIAFDEFGRTTTQEQTEIAQDIFLKLHARGYLLEKTIQQLYCTKCQKFLADRFVEGTCPKCGFEDARGDQCDKCGHLLDPVQLVNPRCKLDGTTPVVRDTEHMFLDLPKLSGALREWIEQASEAGHWTANAKAITHAWLARGLEERCITRDLRWGTPVPLEKYKDKVFYVWFDAPIGYISITAHAQRQWSDWWKAGRGSGRPPVELFQFMGKDNVPFHTVIFPASLIGSGDPYTLLHHVSTTEYLNYEDSKFSKSRGIGVFGNDAMELPIASEVWRFFLLANRPESSDSAFTWDDFMAKNNNELLANLGNFVNRVLKFVASRFDGVVPAVPSRADLVAAAGRDGASPVDKDLAALVANVDTHLLDYVRALDGVHLKEGLRIAMAISALGNKFQQDHKPWDMFATNRVGCERVVGVLVELVVLVAGLLEPYIPAFSVKVANQLALPGAPPVAVAAPSTKPVFRIDSDAWHFPKLPAGHKIGTPQPLFKELQKAEVDVWRERFADKSKKNIFPLDVRVGRILEVAAHPQADKLYVLKIDVGDRTDAAAVPRQVVAGIKAHYSPAELTGRHVAVVCNLKPTKFKSVSSQGMILAAVEGERLGLLVPPEGAIPGTRICAAGFEAKFKANIDHKKDFMPLALRIADVGKASFTVGERTGALILPDGRALTADRGIGVGAKIQ